MAERVSDTIRKEINKFYELPETISKLSAAGIIDDLEEVYANIYELGKSKNFKENFKVILEVMIREIWERKEKENYGKHLSTAYLLENSIKSPRRNIESGKTEEKKTVKNNKSRRSQSHQGDEIYSEFNKGNGYSFGTAPRKAEDKNKAPGPGAYTPNTESVRDRSPRAVMPNTERQSQMIKNSSPGPAYAPYYHFVSK
ncbi:unnamed protein product [Blepharisma stoltei]|uniref:Uncharacterized protein n=1 Tax=Blepharisma stoltei TaxID=1481888 RepID=A0AAU9JKX1_9CILI|nr:unnamed protein product [Blepharisma stoltei]